MQTKVVSFDVQYNAACFVTNHGDVRFVGDASKYGQFGYWSKGNSTVAVVNSNGTTVRSLGDKNYRSPPQDMGKIVKCLMRYDATFALDENNKLNVWGTVKKKTWEALPHSEKIKDIIPFGSCAIIFVKEDGKNQLFEFRKIDNLIFANIQAFLNHNKSGISSAAFDHNIGWIRFNNGETVICHDLNDDSCDKPCTPNLFVCQTEWVANDWHYLYWKTSGGVKSITRRDSSHHNPLNRSEAMKDAVYACSFGDHLCWMNEDYSVHCLSWDWYQRDKEPLSFAFDKKPMSIHPYFIQDADGILISCRKDTWSGADLILSAFPEWADDENIVMNLIKETPKNFQFASQRLRKSVEFSKKVAALGPEHLAYVDGMMRRNRELRSYKRLYEMA